MEKKQNDFLANLELVAIFKNMDTRSAIVAAIVISFVTLVCNGFINLCNYLYWRAYFWRFQIPVKYIDEVSISSNDKKYIAILMLPMLIFFWKFLEFIKRKLCGLCTVYTGLNKQKRRTECVGDSEEVFNKKKRKSSFFLFLVHGMLLTIFLIVLLIGSLIIYLEAQKEFEGLGLFAFLLLLEMIFYLGYTLYGVLFQDKVKEWSRAKRNKTIFVCCVLGVYLFLLGIFIYGGSDKYKTGYGYYQRLNVIDDENYQQLQQTKVVNESGEDSTTGTDIHIVLFETEDYYYTMTARAVKYEDSPFGVHELTIYYSDYAFINKGDCAVKQIIARKLISLNRGSTRLGVKLFDYVQIAEVFLVLAYLILLMIVLAYPHQKIERKVQI